MKLSLGKKIGFGFVLSLIFTLIVGGTGYYALGIAIKGSAFYHEVAETQSLFFMAKEEMGQYLGNRFAEGRKLQEQSFKEAVQNLVNCRSLINVQLNDVTDEEVRGLLSRNRDIIGKYIENFKAFNASEASLIEAEAGMTLNKDATSKAMGDDLWMGSDIVSASKILFAESLQYTLQKQEDLYENLNALSQNQQKVVKKWLNLVGNSDTFRVVGEDLDRLSQEFAHLITKYHEGNVKCNAILQQMEKQQIELKKNFIDIGNLTVALMEGIEKNAKLTILVGIGIAFGRQPFYGSSACPGDHRSHWPHHPRHERGVFSGCHGIGPGLCFKPGHG